MAACKYKSVGKTIGFGTFANIKEVSYKDKNYALKLYKPVSGSFLYEPSKKLEDFNINQKYITFVNPTELDILFRFKSEYLLKGFQSNEDIGISEIGECDFLASGVITEYIEGNLIQDLIGMTFSRKKEIMKSLAKGMQCLHKNGFLYLDCKLTNCMYKKKKEYEGVLIDFGSATYVKRGIEKGIFTEQPRISGPYKAPETIKPNSSGMYFYNNKSDVWSLAIVFIEILTNNFSMYFDDVYKDIQINKFDTLIKFQDEYMNPATIQDFCDLVLDYTKDIHPEIKDFIVRKQLKGLLMSMLNINLKDRFAIEDVLANPFFGAKSEEIVCSVSKIKNYSLDKIDKKYLVGVEDIIEFCKKNFYNNKVAVLFLAIDFYLRYLSIKLLPLKNLPITCCFMALKVYYWSEPDKITADQFVELNSENFIIDEVRIYKALKGRIFEERYYKYAKSHAELFEVYRNFIYPTSRDTELNIVENKLLELRINKNILNYLEQDGEKFIRSLNLKDVDDLENLKIDRFLYSY